MTTGRINQVTMVQNDIKGGGVGAGWEHRSPSPSPSPTPQDPVHTMCRSTRRC